MADIIPPKPTTTTGAGSAIPSPVVERTAAAGGANGYDENTRPVSRYQFNPATSAADRVRAEVARSRAAIKDLPSTIKGMPGAAMGRMARGAFELSEKSMRIGNAAAAYESIPGRTPLTMISSLAPDPLHLRSLGNPNPFAGAEFRGKGIFGKIGAGAKAPGVLMPILANSLDPAIKLATGTLGEEGSSEAAAGIQLVDGRIQTFSLDKDVASNQAIGQTIANVGGTVAQYAIQDAIIVGLFSAVGAIGGGIAGFFGGAGVGAVPGAIAGASAGASAGMWFAGILNMVSIGSGATGALMDVAATSGWGGPNATAEFAKFAEQSAKVSDMAMLASPATWWDPERGWIFTNDENYMKPRLFVQDTVGTALAEGTPLVGAGAVYNDTTYAYDVMNKMETGWYLFNDESEPNLDENMNALTAGRFVVRDSEGNWRIDELKYQNYRYGAVWLKNPEDRAKFLDAMAPMTEDGKLWLSETSDKIESVNDMLRDPYIDPAYFTTTP